MVPQSHLSHLKCSRTACGGYCIEQGLYIVFPSLWKVLLGSSDLYDEECLQERPKKEVLAIKNECRKNMGWTLVTDRSKT